MLATRCITLAHRALRDLASARGKELNHAKHTSKGDDFLTVLQEGGQSYDRRPGLWVYRGTLSTQLAYPRG